MIGFFVWGCQPKGGRGINTLPGKKKVNLHLKSHKKKKCDSRVSEESARKPKSAREMENRWTFIRGKKKGTLK